VSVAAEPVLCAKGGENADGDGVWAERVRSWAAGTSGKRAARDGTVRRICVWCVVKEVVDDALYQRSAERRRECENRRRAAGGERRRGLRGARRRTSARAIGRARLGERCALYRCYYVLI